MIPVIRKRRSGLPGRTSAAPGPSVEPMTSTVEHRPRIATPGRIAGAVAQLAALGVVGPALFGLLFGVLGAGLGLVFALGLGVVVLIGLLYLVFGLAWLEVGRIEGLYRFGLPALTRRRRERPGFVGVFRMLGRQSIDPAMWRATANLLLASLLGMALLGVAGVSIAGVELAVNALRGGSGTAGRGMVLGNTGIGIAAGWAAPIGILVVLLALAAMIGLALLHGVIARALLVPSRIARYAEEARTRSAQRDSAVRAAEVERTRIERDLHDGVQPRLVSVGMTLGLAQRKLDEDPAAARALLEEAHASTKAAITELRQLARGIHASVLDDRGLDAAISAIASRSVLPVELDVRLDGRCSKVAEEAVYFAIAEGVTNAAKHARARVCRVAVRVRDGGTLWARIDDDGVGGASVLPGGGLDGIGNRVRAAGGTLRLDSPGGGPTTLEVSVPCAS